MMLRAGGPLVRPGANIAMLLVEQLPR